LADKTPAQAINHPNWNMGAKISVDSATMMNKSLEWVEAKWLFGIDDDELQIVVHPQSIIHSMVEFADGSVVAQMGQSDMRIPIAHAFGLPLRINSGVSGLNFYDMPNLEFRKPDFVKFPCLRLAREAWDSGGTATTILNAANEVAVQSFLEHKIGFMQIVNIIEETLGQMNIEPMHTMDDVLLADKMARKVAKQKIKEIN
jgi:1-deoxy-D-xylulose-5-phosphate reductoisomerase